MKTLALLVTLIISLNGALAATNKSLVYSGRIIKPDGAPLENTNVQFTIGIYSPGAEDCVLYQETQNINMAGSLGAFSLRVGEGTRTAGYLSNQMEVVFQNDSAFTGLTCASGSTFDPTASPNNTDRVLKVSFNDGTSTVNLANQPIKSVPYALQARNSSRAVDVTGTANISSLILRNASNNQVNITAPAGGFTNYSLVLPNNDGGVGDLLTTDGSGNLTWTTPGSLGGGTVTSVGVAVPAYMSTTADITTAGDITIGFNSQAANTVFAAPSTGAGAPSFRVLAASDIPDLSATYLRPADINATSPLVWTAGTKTMSVAGTANHVAIYNGSGNLASEANLSVSRGGTGAGSFTANQLVATNGTGTQMTSFFCPDGQVIKFTAGIAGCAADNTGTSPGDSGYTPGNKGIVAFDTNEASSGINVTAGVARIAFTPATPGSYGSATAVPAFTIDSFGRVVAITTNNIVGGGDVSGNVNNLTVDKIKGKDITGTFTADRMLWYDQSADDFVLSSLPTCGANQYLTFNGTAWSCAADAGAAGTVSSLTVTAPLSQNNTTGAITMGLDFAAGNFAVNGSNELAIKADGVGATELASTGVTANTYGAATTVPVITVDVDGRLTTVTEAPIALSPAAISNAGSANHVAIYDNAGVLTSEANLAVSRGGTGAGTFTGDQLIATNATGDQMVSFSCPDGQVIKFTSGVAGCAADNAGTGTVTGSGTTNKLAKFTTGTAIGDSVITESSNNIGINNSNPLYQLSLTGRLNETTIHTEGIGNNTVQVTAISNGGAFLQLKSSTGTGTPNDDFKVFQQNDGSANLINTQANSPLNLGTDNTVRMKIDSDGDVGIGGMTDPAARLEVIGGSTGLPADSGSLPAGGLITRLADSTNLVFDIGGYSTGGIWLQSTNRTDLSVNYPILLNPNGGDVAIGRLAPAARLDVNGSIKVANGNEGCTIAGEAGLIRYNSSNLQFCNGSSWQTLTASSSGSISDAGYGTKGIVAFDTNAATSGISISSGVAKLANSGVTAASYGSATAVPVITVDAFGRITAASTANIVGGGDVSGAVNNLTVDKLKNKDITGTFTADRMIWYDQSADDFVLSNLPTCGANQYLTFDGTTWSCAADLNTGSAYTFNSPLSNTAGTIDLGTVPVTKGGTGATSFTANRMIVANGTGSALQAFTCSLNDVVRFDSSGNPTCVAATSTNTASTVVARGPAGEINTGKIRASGQITSAVYDAGSSTTIDWDNGNLQYTSASCGTFTFSNMLNGGTYTLVINGTTSGTCTFSQTAPDNLPAGNFKFAPTNAATTEGTVTSYTFVRVGTQVLVSWITGFN